MAMGLKYLGKDITIDWIAGVPARDLDDAEVKQYPEAASSPLYEQAKATKGKE